LYFYQALTMFKSLDTIRGRKIENMEITENKTNWISQALFTICVFALINSHTEIEIFKWYFFISIFIISFFISRILSNFKIFRIAIYLGFIFLLSKNYFLIENKELGYQLLRIFIISFLGLNLFRTIAYLNPLPYKDKNIAHLTLLEIKASRGNLTNKETFHLSIFNFLSGFLNFKLIAFSVILTFIIWFIFL